MFQPLSHGKRPVDLLKKALDQLPFKGEFLEIHPSHQELTLGFPRRLASSDNLQGFWTTLADSITAEDELLLVQADQPLLDIPLLEEMLLLHHKYYAEYTFADAWPLGLAPQLLQGKIVKRISQLAMGNLKAPDGNTLFSLIQKDINQFDLETVVAPKDYRPYRLDCSVQSSEGWKLVDRMLQNGYEDSRTLWEWMETHLELLRIQPSYVQIQITEQCPQSCSYCPWPGVHPGHREAGKCMSPEDFTQILDKVRQINPEAVISLSPWGEASLHPRIYDFIGEVLRHPGFKLLVETSGIGWDQDKLKPLLSRGFQNWIVSLDSLEEKIYRELRGEGLEEVMNFIAFLEKEIPGQLFCQIVRMEENDDALERLYPEFQQRDASLLVQKYNDFCGRLPQRKICDLSPVNRFPCWHNKRDLFIMTDGTVAQCLQDIQGSQPLGNILQEDIHSLWDKGMELYRQHLQKNYPGICEKCDEYYTYNF